jgi:hypothetical protein
MGEIIKQHPLETLVAREAKAPLGPTAPIFVNRARTLFAKDMTALRAKTVCLYFLIAVRLKVEENQLVNVFIEIGFPIDGLKGA